MTSRTSRTDRSREDLSRPDRATAGRSRAGRARVDRPTLGAALVGPRCGVRLTAAALLGIGSLLGTAAVVPFAASSALAEQPAPPVPAGDASALLEGITVYRAGHGLAALTADPALDQADVSAVTEPGVTRAADGLTRVALEPADGAISVTDLIERDPQVAAALTDPAAGRIGVRTTEPSALGVQLLVLVIDPADDAGIAPQPSAVATVPTTAPAGDGLTDPSPAVSDAGGGTPTEDPSATPVAEEPGPDGSGQEASQAQPPATSEAASPESGSRESGSPVAASTDAAAPESAAPASPVGPTDSVPSPAAAPAEASPVASPAALVVDPQLAPALTPALGAPTAAARAGARGGLVQTFEHGMIAKRANGAPFALFGAIGSAYQARGAEASAVGYPMANERSIGSGALQTFESGTYYWSERTGAFPVRGAVMSAWSGIGWEAGKLGYPISDEIAFSGGVRQEFQRGAIYWDARSGATAVSFGGIRATWLALGGLNSALGAPIDDERGGLREGGSVQHYRGGVMYWSPTAGAHAMRGAILSRWSALGWEGSVLGYPVSEEIAVTGGAMQSFQGGAIYWNAATGATTISRGAIRSEYLRLGGSGGALGLPVNDERPLARGGGVIQNFQHNAAIYWSPSTGAHTVRAAMLSIYAARGFENGSLGYPTSGEYSAGGDRVQQDFQGGTLFWTPGSGSGEVGWRPAAGKAGPTLSPVQDGGGHNLTAGWNGPKTHLVKGRLGIGGPATMDAATISAVKTWQRSHGLSVTGVVDQRTWASLGTGYNWNIDGWTVMPRVGLSANRQQRIDTMIAFALEQRGSQYTWGGAGPYELGYDCSGLALQSMNAAGLDTGLLYTKHSSANWLSTHYFYGDSRFTKLPLSQLQRGDWIFYTDSGGTIRHMALYLGNGQMIHAYSNDVHVSPYSRVLGNNYYFVAPYIVRPFA